MRVGAWEWFKEQARAEVAGGPGALPAIRRPGPAVRTTLGPALTVEDVIGASIEARDSGFTLAQALRLPPVIRGRTLLTSQAAQLTVTLYRDGVPAPDQPRIVTRPGTTTRQEFVAQSVAGLVDRGCTFWRLGDYDEDGRPRFVGVLPHDEVRVSWDRNRLFRLYDWRGLALEANSTRPDIIHIAIGRGPDELHGHGPLEDGLPYLAPVEAAELYAAGWYGSGGVPSVTLRIPAGMEIDDEKSAAIKSKWMTAQASSVPTPAVLAGGIEDHYPDVNPQTSQLQEARSYGATVVARLLGIPGPLLMIESHGSTITYQSAPAALTQLLKETLAPTYLAPIEQAWSDLVGSRAVVRFDLAETQRADIEARYRVYDAGITLGVFSAAEARTWEGIPPAGETGATPALRPTPQPRPLPESVAAEVVPA